MEFVSNAPAIHDRPAGVPYTGKWIACGYLFRAGDKGRGNLYKETDQEIKVLQFSGFGR